MLRETRSSQRTRGRATTTTTATTAYIDSDTVTTPPATSKRHVRTPLADHSLENILSVNSATSSSSKSQTHTDALGRSDSDLETPTKPIKKHASLAKKKQKGMKTGHGSTTQEGPVTPSVSLFDIVMNHGAAIETTVVDWIKSYEEDPSEAMCDLINFIIQAAGCTLSTVSRETIEDPDTITDTLQEIQHQCSLEAQSDYPLAPKGKGRLAAKFRKTFVEFWAKWVRLVNNKVMPHKASLLVELLNQWLATMSSSSFRPFRHTTTTAALAILTGMCEAAQTTHGALVTANRQLETEQGKGISQRLKLTETRVRDLQSKKVLLENSMKDLYDGIFIHRYRDTDSVIRAECIRELGSWISKYPSYYLDSQHLRYLGWMLSDKAAHVRMDTLHSLNQLYDDTSLTNGMRPFSERFKPRIFQMAASEKSRDVRHEAAKTISLLSKAGLIDDSDTDDIVVLIMDMDIKIREAVAPYVAEWWTETYYQPMMDEEASLSDISDIQRSYLELKTLAAAIVQIAQLVAKRNLATNASSDATTTVHTTREQPSFKIDLLPIKTVDLDLVNQMDMTMFERDLCRLLQCARVKAGIDQEQSSVIGVSNVNAAVLALWSHIPCLKNFSVMCDYLLFDSSASTLSPTKRNQHKDQNVLEMTEEEERCLMFIMSSSVEAELKSKQIDIMGKSSKPSIAATLTDVDAEYLIVGQTLIKNLPLLLQKYAPEANGNGFDLLVEVIILIRSIPLSNFADLRQLKAFEVIFDDLIKLFLRRHEPIFLSEACKTFKYLLGKPETESNAETLNGKLSDVTCEDPVSKRAAQLKPNFLLASSLQAVAAGKLHDLVDKLFVSQLSHSVSLLSSDSGVESLTALMRSVKRCRELAYAVDLSKEDVFTSKLSTLGNHDNLGIMDDAINALFQFIKAPPEDILELDSLTSATMQSALEVLMINLGFQLQRSFNAHTLQEKLQDSSTRPTRPTTSDGNGDITDGGDKMSHHRSTMHIYSDAVDISLIQAHSDHLVTVCEAVVSGDEATLGAHFTLNMRWVCLRALMQLYPMLNGGIGTVFPSITRRPPAIVMSETVRFVDRIIHVMSFVNVNSDEVLATSYQGHSRHSESDLGSRGSLPTLGRVPEVSVLLRHDLLKTVEGLRKFVGYGIYDRRCGSVVLKYYGMDPVLMNAWMRHLTLESSKVLNSADLETDTRSLTSPLGDIMTGLGSSTLELVVRDGLGRISSAYVEGLSPESSHFHTVLQDARSAVEDMCDLILDSLTSSIDLYLTGRCPSLDHTYALVKAIGSHIKNWSNVLFSESADDTSPGLKQLHNIIVRALLCMLGDAGSWMAVRIRTWQSIRNSRPASRGTRLSLASEMTSFQADTTIMSEQDRSMLESHIDMANDGGDRSWLCSGFSIVSKLHSLNVAWRVWESLGVAVSHLVCGLFVLIPRDEAASELNITRDSITSVNLVMPYIFEQLTQAGIHPIEDDGDWSDFWNFSKSLEKGSSGATRNKTRKTDTTMSDTRITKGSLLTASVADQTRIRSYATASAESTPKSNNRRTAVSGSKRGKVVSGSKASNKRHGKKADKFADDEGDEAAMDGSDQRHAHATPVRRSTRTSLSSQLSARKPVSYKEESDPSTDVEDEEIDQSTDHEDNEDNDSAHEGENNVKDGLVDSDVMASRPLRVDAVCLSSKPGVRVDLHGESNSESLVSVDGPEADLATASKTRRHQIRRGDRTHSASTLVSHDTDDGFASSPETTIRKRTRRN
ncbi:hypothetical protein BASA62_003520 [Batrachochytrium salamandrivorans]|nr:hypothetical protein BASA62_003520 [Batrachochytrium salamandrivorans]